LKKKLFENFKKIILENSSKLGAKYGRHKTCFSGILRDCRKFRGLNYFSKRRASYHLKAWKFRNGRAFEFFQYIDEIVF